MKRVFIANRGEIAVRIIRACHEMGLEAVVGYSTADADSLAVQMADQAICIGPATASHSYLSVPALITAAREMGCDALHPGYGFLSENAAFVRACRESGLVFIGPSAEAIRAMGDKAEARSLARELGIPTVSGQTDLSSVAAALEYAQEVGYPVLLKAAGGGGGRGLRLIREPQEFPDGFMTAQAEAQSAFGNPTLYLERYLEGVRHVEVQVLADHHGHAVYLGDRDCSIQRRHQKLIEEAPAPNLANETREAMGHAALTIVRALNYVSAGTIEFLYDPSQGAYYFMEMNTRIQVEHPVTECVTGIDLVRTQIHIAAGASLSWQQGDIVTRGHAVECRINAEDARQNFLPFPGMLSAYRAPGGPGVRVDSHCYPRYTVPSDYDSLLAKLVVWDSTRPESLQRMARALNEYDIQGIPTTLPFLRHVIGNPDFQAAQVSTQWLEDKILPLWQSASKETER